MEDNPVNEVVRVRWEDGYAWAKNLMAGNAAAFAREASVVRLKKPWDKAWVMGCNYAVAEWDDAHRVQGFAPLTPADLTPMAFADAANNAILNGLGRETFPCSGVMVFEGIWGT